MRAELFCLLPLNPLTQNRFKDIILSPTEKGGGLDRLSQVQIRVLQSELARRGVLGFGLEKT